MTRAIRLWTGVAALLAAAARMMPVEGLGVAACPFLKVTGCPCPFCGSTRAASLAAHGRWLDALAMSPLGSLGMAATLAVLVAAVLSILFPARAQAAEEAFLAWIVRRSRLVAVLAASGAGASWLYQLIRQ